MCIIMGDFHHWASLVAQRLKHPPGMWETWFLRSLAREDPLEKEMVAQVVKNPPLAMNETQVRSLGQEDPLEKEVAINSSILA